ncbi:MAG TPA: cation:proton antiporter [Kofleriaceae bacterium]|nr:cation:proton antiporter [Kofleriaceae bacterium]
MIPLLLLLATGGLMQAAASFTAAPTAASVQLAFGYLLLTAFFTARIAARFGLPKLTGYILAGVASGPFAFGLVTTEMASSLKIVSGTATAIIALEAGAELQLATVRRVLPTLRAITLFAVVGAMFVLGGVVYLLRPWLPFLDGLDAWQLAAVSMMLGVTLSAQSPAVVMALLAETRAAGPLSEMVLASVVFADLVVILCFSIASAAAGAALGDGLDLLTTARDVGWELFGSMAFGLAAGLLLAAFLRHVKTGASLFALAICVVVAEAGPRVHLDPLIVMLVAGLWIRNAPRTDASALMNGFESAQLPVFLVFFALAGARLDLDTLYAAIVPVALLAAARAASFFVGCRIATSVTRAPRPVQQYAWVGLVPQAGLALAIALVLEKTFPVFGPPAAVVVVGVVSLNQLVAPVILRAVLIRSGEAGKKPSIDFAANGH